MVFAFARKVLGDERGARLRGVVDAGQLLR